jgi:hypothetical protein
MGNHTRSCFRLHHPECSPRWPEPAIEISKPSVAARQRIHDIGPDISSIDRVGALEKLPSPASCSFGSAAHRGRRDSHPARPTIALMDATSHGESATSSASPVIDRCEMLVSAATMHASSLVADVRQLDLDRVTPRPEAPPVTRPGASTRTLNSAAGDCPLSADNLQSDDAR